MDWFVSRDGRTEGPYPEEQLRRMAKDGQLVGAQLRDDQGGAWVVAERSPFGSLMPARGFLGPAVAGLVVAAAGAALFGILGVVAGMATFGLLAALRRLT